MAVSKTQKCYFVTIVIYILTVYFFLVFMTHVKKLNKSIIDYTYLIIIHTEIFMLSWAMITTMVVDPGNPEVFWGFYLDKSENRKRKYCLVCHLFKPERCHHCSKCERCVLGMDHHCPWLLSCIGYYNRRFFLQTLFYTLLSVFTVVAFNLMNFVNVVIFYSEVQEFNDILQNLGKTFIFIIYLTLVFLFFSVLRFTKFHVELVIKNNTTLEILDAERTKKDVTKEFDIGPKRNWESVFGKKWYGCILPITSVQMTSDGIVWPKQDAMFQSLNLDGIAKHNQYIKSLLFNFDKINQVLYQVYMLNFKATFFKKQIQLQMKTFIICLILSLTLASSDYRVCTDDVKIMVDDVFEIVEEMENNTYNPSHLPFKKMTASLHKFLHECANVDVDVQKYDMCVDNVLNVLPDVGRLVQDIKKGRTADITLDASRIVLSLVTGIQECLQHNGVFEETVALF